MKKLAVELRLGTHELLMIKTKDAERFVREKLAWELANTLLKELELTESMDCMSMSKVIRAEILLADEKDIRLLVEAEKFLEATDYTNLKGEY